MRSIADFWRGGPKVTTPNFDNMPFIAGIAAANERRQKERLKADTLPDVGSVRKQDEPGRSSRVFSSLLGTASFYVDPGYDLGSTFLWRPPGNGYVESAEDTQARQRAEAKKLEPPERPDLRKRFVRE